jgi:hypothetical protein
VCREFEQSIPPPAPRSPRRTLAHRRTGPNLPDGVVLRQFQERRKGPRIVVPAGREPIDGLVTNTPVVVNDSSQQLLSGVKGLCLPARMRPSRPLFLEPRVVLVVNRDRPTGPTQTTSG